jgi:hypothetical protein
MEIVDSYPGSVARRYTLNLVSSKQFVNLIVISTAAMHSCCDLECVSHLPFCTCTKGTKEELEQDLVSALRRRHA